jgi:LAO/AO transport system kinase
MEIADIFVVNKSDRDGAATFVKNLQLLAHANHKENWMQPVIKAVATKHIGIEEIVNAIDKHHLVAQNTKKPYLLAEKAYRMLQNRRMKGLNKQQLLADITKAALARDFNLYQFVEGMGE